MVSHDSGEYELLDRLAEEFAQRYRRGERPSLKEYLDKYPALAGEIRDVFPAMVEIEQAEEDRHDPPERTGPAPPPCQVGEYRILGEVGRGGMGTVYEAEQLSLGRRVALKILPLQVAKDGKALERFRREARAAAKLHHTNIVPVFEFGQDGEVCFYAMQFIQGQGLDQIVDELRRLRGVGAAPGEQSAPRSVLTRALLTGRFDLGPPSPSAQASPAAPTECYVVPGLARATACAEADTTVSAVLPGEAQLSCVESDRRHYFQSVARIGQQTALALAYAHARGIVHRDIKPSNLLLDTKGVVWVTDFGLAKTEDNGLTHPGDLLGTLRYMAPERFRGECDARADVYALGLTLYELLVLGPAFAERDRLRLIEQIRDQEPARPRVRDPSIPRDLEIIVLKAIRKDPRRRYQSADELAEDLRRFLAGEPIKARRTGELERIRLWCRRKPAVAALTATLLLLVLAVAVGSTLLAVRLGAALGQSERDRTRAEQAELGGKHKLWQAYLAEAHARRVSRQPGQRFAGLRAIRKALALPVPPGRSRDELRTEAIACLCLPELEVAREWDGWPVGSSGFALDEAFARYARGDRDGNVSVRRLSDDEELFRLPGVGLVWNYRGLKFSPDGRFLHQFCRGNQGFRARLWKLEGPRRVRVPEDHVGFAFSPDSRQLAASFADGSIRLYDTESGREVRRFNSGMAGIELLSWNPRLPQITLCSRRAWRLLDVDTGKVEPEVRDPQGVFDVDWHPEGRLLAVSGWDSKIYLWDATSRRKVLPPLEGHKNGGVLIRFNHAGDRLLSTDWSSLWRLWDVRTGQLLTQSAGGTFLGFSPDDQFVGASLVTPKVHLFRFRSGQEFRTLVHYEPSGRGPYVAWGRPVLDPKGRLLATGTRDGVAVVDVARGEEVAVLKIPNNAALGFEPTGALLTCGPAGILRWPLANDPANGRRRYGPPERLLRTMRNLHYHGMSVDGQVVASPTGSASACALVRLRHDQRTLQLGPQTDVRNAAVSPDGCWVATGSHGQHVHDEPGGKIWEARSGKHVKDLPAGVYGGLSFSPDGKWLLTEGPSPRLWAVGTWQEGAVLGGTPLNPSGAFSPDSKLLALGDAPGVVRLVRVDTGKEIARLTAPEPVGLRPWCFTSDGGQLITSGYDTQALHLFDLRALRAQLAELDLNWDARPLSAAAPAPRAPLRVEIVGANLSQRFQADDLLLQSRRYVLQKQHDRALTALRQAVRADPMHARAHNSLAWRLLVGPEKLRNPEEALRMARKAVELAPGDFMFVNTLGLALYRSGRFAEAVPVLAQSLRMGKGQADAFDLFFLAMCHHRLGDAAKAKECYDRAARWFQEDATRLSPTWVEELRAFQAEAGALLRQPAPAPKE
jgi:serine/threonine protein kinase/WD40 repeat protein/Tfp pilus assembly protein PilF